jgi:hypothetical protein
MLFRLFERLTNLFKWVNQLKNMNGKWLIALLPIVVGLLLVPATAEDITVTASVPPFVSVVFNYNTVSFGTVAPGPIVEAPGGSSGVYNVTVATNVPLNVIAYRTSWTPSEGNELSLWIVAAMSPSDFSTAIWYTLTTYNQIIATNLPIGNYIHYHNYRLGVSPYVPPGTYSTTVTITYTPAA